MQLVSASKMRKSIQLLEKSKHYADLLKEVVEKTPEASHPLLIQYPKARKNIVVVLTTNKGLVGGFNTNIIKKVATFTTEYENLTPKFITLGKKGREAILKYSKNLLADYDKPEEEHIEFLDPLITQITQEYSTGKYARIDLLYNSFVSNLRQEPATTQIFPLEIAPKRENNRYTFEPDVESLIKHLVPRIIESKLLSALLESDAAEHSARMVMMKNATESAGDLLADLTLTLNQMRQNKITTELSEITAGKLALDNTNN